MEGKRQRVVAFDVGTVKRSTNGHVYEQVDGQVDRGVGFADGLGIDDTFTVTKGEIVL